MSTIYFLDIEGNKFSEIIWEQNIMENDNSTTDNVCYNSVICDDNNNTATNNTSDNSELVNGKDRQ